MSSKPPQVENLILLIGENPLPNYVAANLLLSARGTVHLAHTDGTERQAKQLYEVLKTKNISCKYLPLGDSESDAAAIQKKIHERIVSLSSSIGLHYTGGTKAMAVHAYRTLKKCRPDACFSYLDSRHLKMCIDQEDGDPQRFKITPEMISVSIPELLKLHGWEQKDKSIEHPIHPLAAKAFQEFHAGKEASTEWRKWCDYTKKQYYHQQGREDWKLKINILGNSSCSPDGISDNPNNISQYNKITEALTLLSSSKGFLCIKDIKTEDGSDHGGKHFKSDQDVWEWLDGKWLEHYTLHEVQKIPSTQKISNSLNSVNIEDPQRKGHAFFGKKFELDVLFTRGYQLFAISCTTGHSKSSCKSKLFEAYVRAQQLGGIEARVALVCCADSGTTKALKTEILNAFTPIQSEVKDHRVEVFGREDLPDLSNKISAWIRNVDRDAK